MVTPIVPDVTCEMQLQMSVHMNALRNNVNIRIAGVILRKEFY
jgi:hypothetical protein